MPQYISPTDYNHLYKIIRRKNVSAKLLFLDQDENILLVKSTGRDYWTLPGGMVEQNESPKDGAIREIKEELGLDLSPKQLLCVNYSNLKDIDGICLLFFAGTIGEEQKAQIRLQAEELEEYVFLPREQALEKISGRAELLQNLLGALEEKTVFYLENGCRIL